MKPIETVYKGFKFRSRLEARWAVFFDACGVRWEYEPEGYILPNGQYYLPDFLLHDVTFNHAGYSEGNDLYVEVKGKMTAEDAEKIRQFAFPPEADGDEYWIPEKMNPLLVVGNIPAGDSIHQALCLESALMGNSSCSGRTVAIFQTWMERKLKRHIGLRGRQGLNTGRTPVGGGHEIHNLYGGCDGGAG